MDKDNPHYPKILSNRPPLSVNELFINKSRWCQHSNGKDVHGASTASSRSKDAVSWCLGGSLEVVYGHNPELQQAMTTLALDWLKMHKEDSEDASEISISGWNDEPDRTFKEVRKLVTETQI